MNGNNHKKGSRRKQGATKENREFANRATNALRGAYDSNRLRQSSRLKRIITSGSDSLNKQLEKTIELLRQAPRMTNMDRANEILIESLEFLIEHVQTCGRKSCSTCALYQATKKNLDLFWTDENWAQLWGKTWN